MKRNHSTTSTCASEGSSAPPLDCTLCGSIREQERILGKGGRPSGQEQTSPSTSKLELLLETKRENDPSRQLRRCPRCHTLFWFATVEEVSKEAEKENAALSSAEEGSCHPVALTEEQIQELLALYLPFASARHSYKTGLAWRFDVAIPDEAIAADRKKMLAAWPPLTTFLRELKIQSFSSTDLQLPWRFRAHGEQMAGLLKWLERDGHLEDPARL